MPFTANRQFKKNPRMLAGRRACTTHADGRQMLDGTAGLWCVNAGHGREEIVRRSQEQVAEMDYAPPSRWAIPRRSSWPRAIAALLPGDLDHVFFCNSGSEAVDTALKIALAYHRARGEGTRTRSSAASAAITASASAASRSAAWCNRKHGSAPCCRRRPPAAHLRPQGQGLHPGEPDGARIWPTSSSGIVAPARRRRPSPPSSSSRCAGSTGVLPPPKGYLKRLREICDKHGILLIFDEVITGFGRLGRPSRRAFRRDARPDHLAKGITNGTVPMGGVIVRKGIYDAFMNGPENAIELFHGYTYSAHPLACAAAWPRSTSIATRAVRPRRRTVAVLGGGHPLAEGPAHVTDIRNLGMACGIDLAPEGPVGTRGYKAFVKAFDLGLMVRQSGDAIAMSPPLVIEKAQIDEIVDITAKTIRAIA
jgi:beta-alanine--pyruvate transaminase